VLLAGLSALVVAIVQGVPGQIVDVPAAKDALRPGDDIRFTSSEVFTANSRMRVITDDPSPVDAKLAAILAQPGGAVSDSAQKSLFRGLNFTSMKFKIVLEGRRAEEITIESLTPHTITEADPPQGVLMDIPAQGEEDDISAFLDLDVRPHTLRDAVMPKGTDPGAFTVPEPGGPFLASKTISLKDREQVVLNISIESIVHYYKFDFDATYIKGGKEYHKIIDNNGKGFEI